MHLPSKTSAVVVRRVSAHEVLCQSVLLNGTKVHRRAAAGPGADATAVAYAGHSEMCGEKGRERKRTVSSLYEQINMIGRDGIVEYASRKQFFASNSQSNITTLVTRKLEESLSVAAVSYVPDVARQSANVLVKRARARLPNTNREHESRSCL